MSLVEELAVSVLAMVGSANVRVDPDIAPLSGVSGSLPIVPVVPVRVFWNITLSGCVRSRICCKKGSCELLPRTALSGINILAREDQ